MGQPLLTSVSAEGVTHTYTYDGYGNVAQDVTENPADGTSSTVSYTYAPNGQRLTMTLAVGSQSFTNTYTYDLDDRVSGINTVSSAGVNVTVN